MFKEIVQLAQSYQSFTKHHIGDFERDGKQYNINYVKYPPESLYEGYVQFQKTDSRFAFGFRTDNLQTTLSNLCRAVDDLLMFEDTRQDVQPKQELKYKKTIYFFSSIIGRKVLYVSPFSEFENESVCLLKVAGWFRSSYRIVRVFERKVNPKKSIKYTSFRLDRDAMLSLRDAVKKSLGNLNDFVYDDQECPA